MSDTTGSVAFGRVLPSMQSVEDPTLVRREGDGPLQAPSHGARLIHVISRRGIRRTFLSALNIKCANAIDILREDVMLIELAATRAFVTNVAK